MHDIVTHAMLLLHLSCAFLIVSCNQVQHAKRQGQCLPTGIILASVCKSLSPPSIIAFLVEMLAGIFKLLLVHRYLMPTAVLLAAVGLLGSNLMWKS